MPAAPLILPRRCRFLAWLVRTLYFRRVTVRGDVSRRPTLFLLSHRNGVTDGQIYMAALGDTPSLISIQLLRRWYLRLFFAGIPVVRAKDRERYGIPVAAVPSPVRAAIAQIQNGGSLCIYPEGTSAWQAHPLPYQSGMAVIAARLKAAGADFDVQALAAHYSKPDGFRSRVSIIVGPAFRPRGENIQELQEELAEALRYISVDTADNATFNRIQARAWRGARDGADYGAVFLRTQTGERVARHDNNKPPPTTWRTTRAYPPADDAGIRAARAEYRPWAKTLFVLGFPLIAAAALLAGHAADGRNTTTFFRTLGAAAAAVPQTALWLTACYCAPLPALLWLVLGICGWYYYPEPAPVPLEEHPTPNNAATG